MRSSSITSRSSMLTGTKKTPIYDGGDVAKEGDVHQGRLQPATISAHARAVRRTITDGVGADLKPFYTKTKSSATSVSSSSSKI